MKAAADVRVGRRLIHGAPTRPVLCVEGAARGARWPTRPWFWSLKRRVVGTPRGTQTRSHLLLTDALTACRQRYGSISDPVRGDCRTVGTATAACRWPAPPCGHR